MRELQVVNAAELAATYAAADYCVLLVGETTGTLERRLAGIVPTVDCGSVSRAVAIAFERAREGDVVLLAPACASFDQYRNYVARGEDFRRAVQSLGREGGNDA